jgi:hypothetical protein
MSIPPPGYETPQASPPPPPPSAPQGAPLSHEDAKAQTGSRQAGDNVQYELKSVQALRGRESSAKAKWQDQGWEFVSENRRTLRTELNFRRVKPKTFGAHLLSSVAAVRRLQPRTQLALVASGALILVAASIGIVARTQNGGDTPKPSAAQTTASTTPPAETTVTDITVDDLVDKLNSAGMGGMKVGDQFRVTGELAGSEYWAVGASGDFFVMLKTKKGSDLNVFVDESTASGWQDGTKVEMVLMMVEATIRGETTDGWFEAQSAKTISGGTTKEAKEADTRLKLFDALSDYAKAINKGAGATVIDSIEPGSAESVVHVNLNLGFASLSTLEAQTSLKTMNGHLVEIAAENGLGRPMVKFYLADEVVAENRYLLDPGDVKFKGILDV